MAHQLPRHIEDSVVTLSVGGVLYTTRLLTLSKFGPKFGFIIDRQSYEGKVAINFDHHNPFFDRDGPTFRHVLNFMRDDRLILPGDFKDYDMLENEAKFYQIQPLVDAVRKARPRPPAAVSDS